MADMKISDLPAVAGVNDAQQFEVNDGGTSRRMTYQQLRTKVKQGLDDVYAAKNHNHNTVYATLNHNHDTAYATKTHTHTVAQVSDATTVGRDVLKAADPAAARTAIGAGTSNLTLGTTAGTAKAGDWIPDINTETAGQLPYSRLTDVPSLGGGSYTAGDTFVVGRLFDYSLPTITTNNVPWQIAGTLLAPVDGTVRIKFTHQGGIEIRRGGVWIQSWGSQTGPSDRSYDLTVTRGQAITLRLGRNGSYASPWVSNVRFLSATEAPLLVPIPVYPVLITGGTSPPDIGE